MEPNPSRQRGHNYDRKGSVVKKKKSLLVILTGLGAKTN
jgi:hypothetical protein